MMWQVLAHALVLGLGSSWSPPEGNETVRARVWHEDDIGHLPYPERTLAGVMSKKNAGIAFTGGGARAMIAAFGQLRALHDLGLLKNVRYLSGISGGSWATHVFSYYQRGQAGVAGTDEQLLGPIVPPENVTSLDTLSTMDPLCARHVITPAGVQASVVAALTTHIQALTTAAPNTTVFGNATFGNATSGWGDDKELGAVSSKPWARPWPSLMPLWWEHAETDAEAAAQQAAPGATGGGLARPIGSLFMADFLLAPFGIGRGAHFTWSPRTREGILRRNGCHSRGDVREKYHPHVHRGSSICGATFILPSDHQRHPFPIVGMTLLGPLDMAPFRARGSQYTLLEVTPLYIGAPHTSNTTFHGRGGERTLTVGGLVEPFAFGGPGPDVTRSIRQHVASNSNNHYKAVGDGKNRIPPARVDVPAPQQPFGLADATFASSWAPGATLSMLPLPGINAVAGLQTNYWSPAAAAVAADASAAVEPPGSSGHKWTAASTTAGEPFLVADGGDFENVHLIGMIKRRVANIVVFINTNQPLHSTKVWDPTRTAPRSDFVEDMFPYFFGVHVWAADVSEWEQQQLSFDYTANQVFPAADFVPLVSKMQEAQRRGGGIVVPTELTTVANDRWGVEAGIVVNVTWVYLSRLGEWERRLRSDVVRGLVRPDGTSADEDYGETITTGPFKGFPHYATGEFIYSNAQANALASLTGWGVLNNAGLFHHALG